MAVTFGTVELIPQVSPSAAPTPPASASGTASPRPEPRDVARVLRHLHLRAARVRAH